LNPAEVYAPIAQDLPRVAQAMLETAREDHAPLSALASHLLTQPGKRIRPVLTLLAGKLFDYNLDLLVPMAAAVELLHTATLVHDDTLDVATVRRGVVTINRAWDDTTAILFGDFLFASSAEMVARTANVRVMRLFAETLRVICSGELDQYFSAYRCDVTREQYYQRIGCKTAALFSMATESGAVLAGAQEQDVQMLKDYGHNLGLAFQIVDDILDLQGDEGTLGKPAGSDLPQGTLTLPAILYLEQHPSSENPIQRAWENGRRPEDLRLAADAVRISQSLAEAHAIAGQFGQKALEALGAFPDTPPKRALASLVEYSLSRDV